MSSSIQNNNVPAGAKNSFGIEVQAIQKNVAAKFGQTAVFLGKIAQKIETFVKLAFAKIVSLVKAAAKKIQNVDVKTDIVNPAKANAKKAADACAIKAKFVFDSVKNFLIKN